MLTQDPIGLAGGVNLYAYAGNSPINFWDPFGLMDVVFGGSNPKAAEQAYKDAKAAMGACAAGRGCSASQSRDATAGLATLAAAEADHSVVLEVRLDAVATGSVSVSLGATGGTITIDRAKLSASRYDLPGVVAHEVHEGYERVVGARGDASRSGRLYPFVHGRAVRYAEDPSLLGSGLPSRTSRSPGCNVGPAPQTFGAAPSCFAPNLR